MSLGRSLSKVFAWTSLGIVSLLTAAPAEAGRPRSTVLDEDTIAITHDVEFESWANLVLMRSPAGEALVVETRPDAPVQVRRLGVPILIGLAHEPVETVGLAYGVALEEIVLAYESVTATFRPVEPRDGGWIFGDD